MIEEVKLARGVVYHDGKILLVQDTRPGQGPTQGHFFLPGGHVEPGEAIHSALIREFKEELGWQVHVGSFVGCIEHKWNVKTSDGAADAIVEMNYLFRVGTSTGNLMGDLVSREPHLKFSWVARNRLSAIHILPAPLKTLIPNILDAKPVALWASTL